VRSHHHRLQQEIRTCQCQLLHDPGAQRSTDYPRRPVTQVLDQRRYVADQIIDGHSASALVRRRDATVIHGDHLVAGRDKRWYLVELPHPARAACAHHQYDHLT
jgi:hypothetical protein